MATCGSFKLDYLPPFLYMIYLNSVLKCASRWAVFLLRIPTAIHPKYGNTTYKLHKLLGHKMVTIPLIMRILLWKQNKRASMKICEKTDDTWDQEHLSSHKVWLLLPCFHIVSDIYSWILIVYLFIPPVCVPSVFKT